MSVFRGASVGITLTANKSKYSAEMKAARAELRGWERDVSQGAARFKRIAANVGRTAAIGFGVAGTAAVVAGVKMVNMAGDVVENTNKLSVTFGKALPQVTKRLDEFAAATGASRYELQQQVGVMGALLKSAKLTDDQLVDFSVNVTKLATDLSSFHNVASDDALKALRSGLSGEIEPLRRFGIFIDEAAVKAYAMNQGLAETVDTLTAADKIQARYALILQQTNDAQGDAARTSDSYANTIRRIQNAATDAQVQLGQAMLPAVTELANGLATFVQGDQFSTWIDGLGDSLGDATGDVTRFLESTEGQQQLHAFANGARDAFTAVQQVAGALGSATMFAVEHRNTIAQLALTYGTFRVAQGFLVPLAAGWQLMQVRYMQTAAAMQGATKAQIAFNTATRLNPIGLIAAGAAIAGTALVSYKLRNRDVETQSDRTSRAIKSVSLAMQSVNTNALAFDEARLNRKISLASLDDAKKRLDGAKQGTTEYRDALLGVEQAELAVKRANSDVAVARKKYNDEVDKSADKVRDLKNEAKAERDEIHRLLPIISRQRRIRESGVLGADAARKAERKYNEELRQAKERLKDANAKLDDANSRLGKNATKTDNAAAAWKRVQTEIGKADRAYDQSSFVQFGGMGAERAEGAANSTRRSIGSGWPLGGGLGRGIVGGVDSFTPMAARAGLTMTSALRPGDPGYHGLNRARDYSNSTGPTPQMLSFARFLAQAYGSSLKELIYTPLGFSIKNGKRVAPYAQAQHYNHVHVAYQRGTMGVVPGQGSGDKVPALLEPFEGVLNRNAVAGLGGPGFVEWANTQWPRFATGRTPRRLPTTGAIRLRASRQARIAADPELAFRAAKAAYTRLAAARITLERKIARTADKKTRATLQASLRELVERQKSAASDLTDRTRSVVDARSFARDEARRQREEDAAKAQTEATEARQRELDAPRAILTLTDAVRDLERAQAEATATLEDDIAVARRALADETTRQAAIQSVLARADLTDAERADALQQLATSVRAVTSLDDSIKDMSATVAAQSGGATLDDLLAQLRTATQALWEMGANEAGNVIKIAKLEQQFPAGTGLDTWRLATEAQLQGAV